MKREELIKNGYSNGFEVHWDKEAQIRFWFPIQHIASYATLAKII
jgi:hypothetical protein